LYSTLPPKKRQGPM